MEKGSLKLKLKLGSTPEPSADMDAAENNQPMSEEDEEEMGQEENAVSSVAESSKDKSHKKSKKKKKKKERERDKHRHKRDRNLLDVEEDGDDVNKKRIRGDEIDESLPTENMAPAIAEALQSVLNYLVQHLIKKDINQFFIEPVTDAIAPGYSSIITEPMCFKAMLEKIKNNLYNTMHQFENDVKLIVSNCIKYNGPDTVYSSAGKKLLAATQSLLSKDKLVALKNEIPTVVILTPDIVGFPLFDFSSSDNILPGYVGDEDNRTDTPTSQESSHSENSLTDDDDAAFILSQAADAARKAAVKLHTKKPTSTMGYIKTRPDGKTGLTFISGCEGSEDSTTPAGGKMLNMGLVVGKLASGSATLHNYHDDKRTMAKPVKPVQYGSYSSFCPNYDSTFSNLSKDESDLVRATYGNETAVQYAESICDFSRDCTMATTLVDQLLNLLTRNQHSKTQSVIATGKEQQNIQQQSPEVKKESNSSDLNKLRSLSTLGIDVGFLDSFEQCEASPPAGSGPLSHSAELVQSLSNEQNARLSKPLVNNCVTGSQPTASEIHLAEKLRAELVSVARQLPPSAILPTPSPSTFASGRN